MKIIKEIDGKVFVANKLNRFQMMKEGLGVRKALNPLRSELIAQQNSPSVDFRILVAEALISLEGLKLESLMPLMLKGATVDSEKVDYDETFQGNFGLYLQVAVWLIVENFVGGSNVQ
ncbi:hypothetical protein CGK32_22760 [Vibrio parahaemolyticus]|uniref:phage tail assembly chaperone n=1 Tax=Vibrio parahaemolyticus TaxID=670 RepID=UPI00111EBA28|nr:hypothetical protein [Vibrio parahaemolyticus]TOA18438.1 hypothetical protein CGK32_22760 [Vibrio parahaemolyticus]